MEVVYILQIVTIIVSVVSIISSVIVTISTNRSQNISNIVANQRLVFLKEYRQKSSLLLTLCSPQIISTSKDDEIEREIIQVSYELKNIFKGCYSQEREILRYIDIVVENSLAYKADPENLDLKEKTEKNIQQFFRIINIYDLAYWRFIIDQASGKKYKVDDFDTYYTDAEERFKKI